MRRMAMAMTKNWNKRKANGRITTTTGIYLATLAAQQEGTRSGNNFFFLTSF